MQQKKIGDILKKNNLKDFLEYVSSKGFYSSEKRLKFKLEQFFGGVDLRDKNVLDIGGGIGLLSFYAVLKGAKNSLCLEPLGDGSTSNVHQLFYDIKQKLNLNNVMISSKMFQELEDDTQYDLVVLHNSINHLNEYACINLKKDGIAYSEYLEYFNKFNRLLKKGGEIIISDCSCYNFWEMIKLKNPIDPNIEWFKHQSPSMWSRIAKEADFTVTDISWNSFNRLGRVGKFLFGRSVVSFFLTSHFTIYAKKNG